MAGKGKRVLFLVPSLSLLGQTLTEWTQESSVRLKCFAVCSDSDVGKRRGKEDDRVISGISDLQYPATTNAISLQKHMSDHHSDDAMTVVFSTYHSIAVLNEAQSPGDKTIPAFDLIICDEAHRTTGATFDGEEESAFVRVHDNDYIQGAKRLYMTATPRIYGESAKQTENVTLCSMDDSFLYGEELYVITFSEAVSRKLLVDYKVVVLAVEETHVNRRLQSLLKDADNSLKVDDAAKIVGCWKALSKQGLFETAGQKAEAMKRAVAFCQVIEKEYKGKNHKVSSKLISEMFGAVVAQYQEAEIASLREKDPDAPLDAALTMLCDAEHVDGSMNASEKEAKLEWLKATTEANTCRILSNVRCLSEGVDVPALDAVLFLTPRSSQVDVVQSVGRVMRLSPGKELGYVILPVVIPAGVEPEEALNSNETYRVVWQVLNALRSHDDRFDAMINKLEFNGSMPSKMEVVAVADKVVPKATKKSKKERKAGKARGGAAIGSKDPNLLPEQAELVFEVGDIERALYAKIVKKCGNRHHWEDWANDIAKIANTHIDRIKAILEDKNHTEEIDAFNAFAAELRDDLNNSISDEEIIEMLAQHLITKPVFDALFEEYSFAKHNPMSQAMQQVLDKLHEHHLDKERGTLDSFYESVKMRAEGINSAEGKQRIVVELYDKFFRNAFPRMTDRLGIVYTPIEVVDFMIQSVEKVLKNEFSSSMADENVHILDPFTGTGTFITRLLQSGIIPEDRLPGKYKNNIHANEIVLLAYYIAAINIEATYHGILTGNISGERDDLIFQPECQPFNGICLTDTFQMGEKSDLVDELLEENSARRKRQQALDIRVIIGNPPYSRGQSDGNDNAKNQSYPNLEHRISETYAAENESTLSRDLYNSYIKAFRWASDRIDKDSGIIAFITGGGFIDKGSYAGFRKSLAKEFNKIYVFNLRGDIRGRSKEDSKREGQNVFDIMTGVTITILVKNRDKNEKTAGSAKILFGELPDSLSKQEKLDYLSGLRSINSFEFTEINPNEKGDWINQRNLSFESFIRLTPDKKFDLKTKSMFVTYAVGIGTNRDSWVYNYSKKKLEKNMANFVDFYNEQTDLYKKSNKENIDDFIDADAKKIKWTRSLKTSCKNGKRIDFDPKKIVVATYRPFNKQFLYFDKNVIESPGLSDRFFPTPDHRNKIIMLPGTGSVKDFYALCLDTVRDLDTYGGCQTFPLYYYEEVKSNCGLFDDENIGSYVRRDGISDFIIEAASKKYGENEISKEDIFFYVYGLLHSPDYRITFANDLKKMLPRLPLVESVFDFWTLSKAGRNLSELHLNYESMSLYTKATINGKSKKIIATENAVIGGEDKDFHVKKMKFLKKGDKTKVLYNENITIENIPSDAYDYVVNGRSALEWVMERQAVLKDNNSDIVNDANDWAVEAIGNARYPLELFLRMITVSLETQEIVKSLPKLDML
ncbi:DNA damage-inducible protein [Marinobacter shengliensis]|nr:DNA damage-inducible protein [Marinobacter shengliensis]